VTTEIPQALRLLGDALHRTADLLELTEELNAQSPFTVDETAAALRVDERTIRRYITDGKLNAFKVAGQWRIPRSDLASLIDRSAS
jgi:excisionase family DNA binding protein